MPSFRKAVDLALATLQRVSARVALGSGLLSLLNPNSRAASLPAVPVRDLTVSDVQVNKLSGKYILKQTRSGPAILFAQHRSHSSHSSHASHASHYSGSSGHSSAPPPRVYAPPPPTPTPAAAPYAPPPTAPPTTFVGFYD